jgi:hypothetical protein
VDASDLADESQRGTTWHRAQWTASGRIQEACRTSMVGGLCNDRTLATKKLFKDNFPALHAKPLCVQSRFACKALGATAFLQSRYIGDALGCLGMVV